MRVILGLLLWSLVEISLFVVVGGAIGLAGTLAVVIGTGVAGVIVLRRLGRGGLSHLRQVRGGMAQGAHAGFTAIGGILLILPGFLTDILGLLLMVPPVREWLMGRIVKLGGPVRETAPFAQGEVIDAEVVEVKADGPREPSGWTKP